MHLVLNVLYRKVLRTQGGMRQLRQLQACSMHAVSSRTQERRESAQTSNCANAQMHAAQVGTRMSVSILLFDYRHSDASLVSE